MTDEMREERRRKEGKQLQGKKLDVQLKIIRDKPLFFWRGWGMRNMERNCLQRLKCLNKLLAKNDK